MHKTRPPPLPDSCSLSFSLSPTIFNSVARIRHKNLVGPSPFLSLSLSLSPSLSVCVCVCVCGGGVFLVRIHIYTIYRSLSHTMYDTLASPS